MMRPGEQITHEHFVYVDNLGCFCSDEEDAKRTVSEWVTAFESRELLLHKSEVVCGPVTVLGSKIDGDQLTMAIKDDRLMKVQAAVAGLLARGRTAGWCVEVLLGHLTFCGLANRGILTVPHTLYRLIRRHYTEAAPLWAECRDELAAMSALLFLARADWKVQWNPVVYQSDASGSGWGVKTAVWPLSAVQRCGRLSERRHVKRLGSHSAREAALGAAGLTKEDGEWICDRHEGVAASPMEDWAVDASFEEVDPAGLREGLWSTVRLGTWSYTEDIMVLEARACLKSVERLVLGIHGHDIRQLFLLDNMSLVICLARGRSRSFGVLVQLRRIYSYCMVRNVMPHFRWIPSELNSSDEPSRSVDDKASSLATRAIEHLRFEPVAVLAHTRPRGLPGASPDDAGDPQPMCSSLCHFIGWKRNTL